MTYLKASLVTLLFSLTQSLLNELSALFEFPLLRKSNMYTLSILDWQKKKKKTLEAYQPL